jgi:hypothetical protein
MLMRFLQRYEDSHPDEAKAFLSGIADKLRADAEHAGPWSNRLNAWADKFDAAAESGDLSGLAPNRPHAHFGMRAYQRAQGSGGAGELSDIARSVPMNGSLTITSTTTTTVTISRSGAESVGPSAPASGPSAPPAGQPVAAETVAPTASPSKTRASDVATPDGNPIIIGTAA